MRGVREKIGEVLSDCDHNSANEDRRTTGRLVYAPDNLSRGL